MKNNRIIKYSVVALCGLLGALGALQFSNSKKFSPPRNGVSFHCSKFQLQKIEKDLDFYLSTIEVKPDWYTKYYDENIQALYYTLNTPVDDFDTLSFKDRKMYSVKDELVSKPISADREVTVSTVSRKEIVLSLFQRGRDTRFKGDKCNAQSFIDHVGIRQNTVLWAQKLEWVWPDGGPAFWNKKYWINGTPKPGVSINEAFMDMFINQNKYAIGCYTASKMVMVQAVLDYYKRVQPNSEMLKKIINKLMVDNEPLVGIEPHRMWSFEKGHDHSKNHVHGKILDIMYEVAPMNFVPGDWAYLLNTDAKTYEKTGYEGSNAIYLGGGKFDDYYNDHNYSYTYKQKLNEVYQWRNGVFSRSRDKDKIKPVSEQDYHRFGLSPEKGGLVLGLRTFHELL